MKKTHLILLFLFLLGFSACKRQSVQVVPEMMLAEKMLANNPDSARKLLAGVKNEVNTKNEATRKYYDMLVVKADTKCSVKITSDSTMSEVVRYYEHYGTKQQLLEAYYLMGLVYYDMESTAKAIDYLHKASEVEVTDDSATYRIRALVYSYRGHINMYQDRFKEAMPFFIRAYRYACLSKDPNAMAYMMRDIGRCYAAQGMYKICIEKYTFAARIAKNAGYKNIYQGILSELASNSIDNKDYTRARNILNNLGNIEEEEARSIYYNTLGDVYTGLHKLDSAVYCYKKSLEGGTVYTHQSAAQSIYLISSDRGDYKQASDYAFRLALCTDSIENLKLKQNQSLIESLNKKMDVEKENNRLKLLQKELYMNIAIGIAVVVIVFSVWYTKYKNLRRKGKKQRDNLQKALDDSRQSSDKMKAENEAKISEMKEQMEMMDKERNAELQSKLLKVKTDMLYQWNGLIDSHREEQMLLEQELQHSDIYQSFHGNMLKMPDNNDFMALKEEVDHAYHHFSKRLTDLYPAIKEKELRTCLLLKINLSPKEICALMNMSPSTASMIRSRLYQKIFNKKGSADDFDDFIKTLQ